MCCKSETPSFAPSKPKSIPASVEQVDSLSPEGVSPEVNILMSTKRERLRADVWMLNGFFVEARECGEVSSSINQKWDQGIWRNLSELQVGSWEILVLPWRWTCFFFGGGELRFQNFKLWSFLQVAVHSNKKNSDGFLQELFPYQIAKWKKTIWKLYPLQVVRNAWMQIWHEWQAHHVLPSVLLPATLEPLVAAKVPLRTAEARARSSDKGIALDDYRWGTSSRRCFPNKMKWWILDFFGKNVCLEAP